MDSKVEALLQKPNWQEERKALRAILLGTPVTEVVKWGKLCYQFQGRNLAMIYGLKHYCAVGFFKGALLKDTAGRLVSPGEHSQAMRQIRFTSLKEILDQTSDLKALIHEAIQVEKAGLEVDFKEKQALVFPDELTHAFEQNPALKTAFMALTPGRQRGYVLHFSGAKQSKTRTSRIEKCLPRILEGKGLQDR